MLNVHEVSMLYFKEVVKIHHIHSTLVSRCACVVFLNPRLGLREKVLTIQLTKFTDIFEQQQQVPSRQIWFSWLNIRLLINLFFFAIPSIKPLVATQTLLYIHPEKFEEDESPILTCAHFFLFKKRVGSNQPPTRIPTYRGLADPSVFLGLTLRRHSCCPFEGEPLKNSKFNFFGGMGIGDESGFPEI